MISVLIVEDDPMVAQLHKEFIQQVPGFHICALVRDGVAALTKVRECQPELIILDVYLPELDGLGFLRQLRRYKLSSDVILVSAANDRESIQEALRLGAVDIVIKPFTFERLKKSLENYALRHSHMEKSEEFAQSQLDDFLTQMQEKTSEEQESLPKGILRPTLMRIRDVLNQANKPVSAEDVGNTLGIARVTARRYLEYLVEAGEARMEPLYGTVGRPINYYELRKPQL